ncbi:MAG: hypothetical protein ACLQVI_10905 [Polyangiaceae bacterium]
MKRYALCLVSSLVALACSKSNETQPTPGASASAAESSTSPPAPPPSAPSATAQKRGERGPGHGGVDSILFRAARDLPLSDDLKAKVEALEGQLHDRDTNPRDAMKTFSRDLAAQVRTGKLDVAQLQPDEAGFDTAMKDMLDKQAKALAGLHDALDAGQRKALADAVHAKAAAREAEAKARDAGATDWVARRLERMTSDLGLDDGQQKQVAALLAKQPSATAMRDDMKMQVEVVLTAFQGDTFDASKALQVMLKGPHEALDRQIAFTGKLLPLLHPDQREKLAASTTRPPGRGGSGGWSADEEESHGGGGTE